MLFYVVDDIKLFKISKKPFIDSLIIFEVRVADIFYKDLL